MKLKKIVKVIIFLFVLIVIGIGSVVFLYNLNIQPVDKNNNEKVKLTIEENSTSKKIGKVLKANNLIKNELAFNVYIKLNKVENLKAGKYILRKDMDVKAIIKQLKEGENDKEFIKITFKEGLSIPKVAEIIAKNTSHTKEDVYKLLKDEKYLNKLINDYWFIKEDIKNPKIYYSLEGYLFSDTYIYDKDPKLEDVFKKMLDQMEKTLTGYKQEIENSKYSVHELLTLASMIELEGSNLENRKTISGVFYNRLKLKMSLGSDVTTYYAKQIDLKDRDLSQSELNEINDYNTRAALNGLPVSPICNPGKESIEASIKPNQTDYLFFVADKYKNIYFTKTNREHEMKVQEIKRKGDWIEW